MNPHYPHFDDRLPLPYLHLDSVRDLSRLSADISVQDKNLIKHVCPKKGILNQITQNLFASIAKHLRQNGITYYSPEHEAYLVRLISRGCSTIESAEHRPNGLLPGGTTSADYTTPRDFIVSPQSPQSPQRPEGDQAESTVESSAS